MIKNPGGYVGFWSALFIPAGSYLAYDAFAHGKTVLAVVFAILPIGSALIWLGIRHAKWLLAVYFGIATVGALTALISDGVNLSTAVRAMFAAWTATEFALWNKPEPSVEPVYGED